MATTTNDFLFDLLNQIRGLNARLAEKDRANAEKERMIASLTEKLNAVLKHQKLNLESWLAKGRKWDKERKDLLKKIKDLNDIVKVLNQL